MKKANLHLKIEKEQTLQEIYLFKSSDNIKLFYPLEKQDKYLELFIFFRLNNEDNLNLQTITRHLARNTSAFTYVCGVVFDKANVRHEGMIKIEPEGQFTNAYLKSSILLIGEEAKAESIPSLEIEAHEVKASHGSSIGQIDPEQMFYLESRGLDKTEAEKLLIEGFFESYLFKIKSPPDREKIRAYLAD